MKPLKITLKLAQKFINSEKIEDFEIYYKNRKKGHLKKVSSLEFKKEELSLAYYLQKKYAKSCTISFKTNDNILTFNVVMNNNAKMMKV